LLTRPIATLLTALALGASFLILAQRLHLQAPGGQSVAVAGTMSPDQSTDNSGTPPDQTGTTGAAATPAATATPVAAATPAPSGTVLASDNFSNPGSGLFATSAPDPSWIYGYSGGDYQITSAGNVALADQFAFSQGGTTWTDVSIAVDAHLMSDADSGDSMGTACRITGNGSSLTGYRMYLAPANGEFNVQRIDNGKFIDLSGPQSTGGAPMQFNTYHLQLTCSGTTVSATINGKQVYSTQDSAYTQGKVALLVHMFHRTNASTGVTGSDLGKVDVHFDNFVLTQP